MQAILYKNLSDKKYMNKTLVNGTPINIHFKDDSEVIEPLLYISRTINMVDFNYLYISALNRYYYIDKVIESQQRYEVHASVDALMSFKEGILEQACVVERGALNYNLYLQDDMLKDNVYTHRDIYFFKSCFDKTAQEFVLTVVGNSDTSYKGGGNSGGGSSNNTTNISITTYEQIPQEEKENNNQIYTVPDEPPQTEEKDKPSNYLNIASNQYDDLPEEQKMNGSFYYVSNSSNGSSGYRNMEVTRQQYNSLSNEAKNNNIPYFVRSD